ncbi:hypothetical protein EUTSA_v10000488mg, partial [Eutrema salsugineum]
FKSTNLSGLRIIEIQSACIIENQCNKKKETLGFRRVVIGGNYRIIRVGCDSKIPFWDGMIWTRIRDQQAQFCDIVNNIAKCCWRDRRLVDCCEEFYIVDRLLEDNIKKRKVHPFDPRYSYVIHDDAGNTERESSKRNFFPKTSGFKVYKIDEELWKCVEAKSLGDNAFVMATDTCFSVFKLEDGSITIIWRYSQSCFQMFVPLRFH